VQRIDANTRLIEYFLAVAQDLHFRRAAERLHVSQPAVSRGVQHLEASLGVPLFVRTGRTVRLTAAGQSLKESAPEALRNLVRTLEQARAVGLGQREHLSVSYLPSARFVVLPAVQLFQKRYGTVRLAVHEALDGQQFADLASQQTDLGVVRGRRLEQNLVFKDLVNAELCVALAATHTLATAEELSYEDLANEQFVLWPREDSPEGYDHVVESCQVVGFTPRIVAETSEAQTVLALVAAGVGVSILGSPLRETAGADVVFVPLHDEHDTLYLVWRADDDSLQRRNFSNILLARSTSSARVSSLAADQFGRIPDRQ
jgi:DNA-binding transcriptional LysR family regulator